MFISAIAVSTATRTAKIAFACIAQMRLLTTAFAGLPAQLGMFDAALALLLGTPSSQLKAGWHPYLLTRFEDCSCRAIRDLGLGGQVMGMKVMWMNLAPTPMA